MANLTNKNLDFLSNEKLINVLSSVLDEIDVVASSGAHRSTTYLAVSAIEGLFRELFNLLRLQPSDLPPGVWPKEKKTFKKLDKLSLEEMAKVLQAANALPHDFEIFYDLLRKYRNYMHPAVELRDLKPINRSIGQLALASLNALIEKYRSLRFVALHEWRLEYGLAQVPANNVIHMPQIPGDPVSLLVSEYPAKSFRELSFKVNIPRDAIFNFVYNYFSLDQFMAARIEGRAVPNGEGFDNGRIVCTKWRVWPVNGRYTAESEPSPKQREHNMRVVLNPMGNFDIYVNDKRLILADGLGWDFDPEGKIGFMTEWGLISLVDLQAQSW